MEIRGGKYKKRLVGRGGSVAEMLQEISFHELANALLFVCCSHASTISGDRSW